MASKVSVNLCESSDVREGSKSAYMCLCTQFSALLNFKRNEAGNV
jgi:hypothetical protein